VIRLQTNPTLSLVERLAPPATYGLRSVIAPILPTQHNKTALTQGKLTLNTAGRRPFAPRSPADLNINDIAKFTRPDGRICRGVVKFIGHLHDKNETYVGLELEYQGKQVQGLSECLKRLITIKMSRSPKLDCILEYKFVQKLDVENILPNP